MSPEETATNRTRQRQRDGHAGESDRDEAQPADARRETIAENLAATGVDAVSAGELAATTVDEGLKYLFAEASIDTAAFFTVGLRGGVISVMLNTDHPAYDNLVAVLDKDGEGATNEDLLQRMNKARDGLKLLLTAWARYEDEQPAGPRRQAARDARSDWGKVARQFLDQEG